VTFREIFGNLSGPVAITIGLALGGSWSWKQRRKRHVKAVAMDTSDPIWLTALEKARSSVPRFRELAAAHPTSAFIKFALQTTTGATEHVWGPVILIGESAITAGLETPPIEGSPASAPPYEVQMSSVEDWRVETPDGRIYGAYTASAQIAYARKKGYPIPSHMLQIEKNIVDS
jgi:hypothetical protein